MAIERHVIATLLQETNPLTQTCTDCGQRLSHLSYRCVWVNCDLSWTDQSVSFFRSFVAVEPDVMRRRTMLPQLCCHCVIRLVYFFVSVSCVDLWPVCDTESMIKYECTTTCKTDLKLLKTLMIFLLISLCCHLYRNQNYCTYDKQTDLVGLLTYYHFVFIYGGGALWTGLRPYTEENLKLNIHVCFNDSRILSRVSFISFGSQLWSCLYTYCALKDHNFIYYYYF